MTISILIPHLVLGYPWPIAPFDQQHQINATLGEWREGVRFHQGVDIRAGIGIHVYPVVSGVIPTGGIRRGENGYVWVRANGIVYEYWHINPSSNLRVGQRVIAGQTILGVVGDIPRPHLHLEEDDGALNPLRNGGLTPFGDNHLPEIDRGSIQFIRQGQNEPSLDPNRLYEKVDIRVRATDRRIASNGSAADSVNEVGVYRIGYELWRGNRRIEEVYKVQFDSIPNPRNSFHNF